ncbi:stress response protein NST1-like [Zingiber officinale]|uniref:Uncharacterized protein n=1 Tax=Zingiber officinale TaxID=94328 RepID=A0A8J5KYJ7_ZINOF|nr:stress response protein NST1-like [Zingiber officinale]KAG6501279.1 hypothetical protein ZIOFF_041158 [Zingiber officinale]
MKRKKWRAEEEATLIREYAALLSPAARSSLGALLVARLRTREKKFQPIADRVNAAHNLRDPNAFPFLWSWRDISVKIHNMRHQFLHVKRKIHSLPTNLHDEHALHLWPNFIIYKQVFGDHHDPLHRPSLETAALDENRFDDDSINEEDDGYDDVEEDDGVQLLDDFSYSDQELMEKDERGIATTVDQGEESEELGLELPSKDPSHFRRKKVEFFSSKMVEIGEIAMRREERRREKELVREEEYLERELQKRAFVHQREMDEEEDRRLQWRKRRLREERREVEDMEWRERILVMQMEHEKQAMQMQADAFQAQMQMIAILVRIICQFLGGGAGGSDGGIGGMQHQVMQPQQQEQQESPETLVGDNGKNGDDSTTHYV